MSDEKKTLPHQGTVATGSGMPDPKDRDPDITYTTTPSDDRVGAADHRKYQPVKVPDIREVTGPFDHLATRDPVAMEHALQSPEFQGVQSVAALGANPETLDQLVPGTGIGLTSGVVQATERVREAADPNPNYTPPSRMTPQHVKEVPGDLPQGETPELINEVEGHKKA